MRILAWVLLAILLARGAQAQELDPDLRVWIDVRVPQPVVEFGAPFPLEVVRVWRSGFEPSDWKDAALAPLRVQLVERREERVGELVRETLSFRAHAFSLEPLLVPSVELLAKDGQGRELASVSAPLHIQVGSTLEGRDPVEPEGLPPLLPAGAEPGSRWPLYAVLAGFLTGLVWFFARIAARTRERTPVSQEVPVPSSEDALRGLEGRVAGLAGFAVADRDADQAFHIELSDLLREIVHVGFDVGSPEETTREWLRDVERASLLEERILAQIGSALRDCDYVKFAGARSDEASRAELNRLAARLLDFARPSEEVAS